MKTHAQPIWRMAVLSFCLLLSAVSWGQTSTTVEIVTENLTLSEPGEYHITATEGCIADGVTIDITSKDAWLFFDNLRPSQVIGQWLSRIKVDGEAAGHKRNVFVNIYGNGAAVVPHTPNDEVLTVYTGEMYEGRSYGYKPGTYANLGSAFNNAIRSFKLKRGYMAIMAQGSLGELVTRQVLDRYLHDTTTAEEEKAAALDWLEQLRTATEQTHG